MYDVNSLYPATMYSALLPYGKPVPYAGKYEVNERYPLYVQKISCMFELKDGYIPTVQIKHDPRFNSSEYLESSNGEFVTLYMTNVDMDLMFEHYNVFAEEYQGGLMFQGKYDMFDTYINKWMFVKANATGGRRTLAKLYLNNLYGKFGSNPDVTGKYPYLDENGAVKLALKPQEIKDPVYLPIAVFTTAWARNTTITTAQAVYDRILYCDTDSIHISGTHIPTVIQDRIDPRKLGYWKHESTFGRGKFLRSKTYIEDIDANQNKLAVNDFCSYPFRTDQDKLVTKILRENDKDPKSKIIGYELDNSIITKPSETYSYHIRAAGMQDKARTQVTWQNFEIGMQFDGNLGKKHVKGGILLIDKPFKIRKSAFGYGL